MQNTFPKAAEIIASYVYLFTGILESVKAINLIILISAIFLAFITFNLFLPNNKFLTGFLSLIASLNPVWVTQSTQFYIDGFYYEIVLIVTCLMLYYVKSRGEPNILLTILLGLVLAFNVKGSSLLIIPILVMMFILLLFLNNREKIKSVIPLFLLSLLMLLLITGYSPYIVNQSKYSYEYSTYADPLGKNALLDIVDSTSENVVIEEKDDSTIENELSKEKVNSSNNTIEYIKTQLSAWLVPRELFFKSLFSPVSQQYTGMKNPFNIDLNEIPNLTGENRINGYGPFLGLIILLSLLIILLSIFFHHPMGVDAKLLSICSIFIFISVILHPATWCARYVPQFYIILIFIALIGLISTNSVVKYLSVLLLVVLVVNIFFISAYWYPNEAENTRQFDNLLTGIKESASGPIVLKLSADATRTDILNVSYRLTNIALLQERGIPWSMETRKINGTLNFTVPLFFQTDALVIPKSKIYTIGDTIPATVMGRYAMDGFSSTLGTHIWTDRHDARLNLTITNPPEKLSIILKARPYHVDDHYINQTLWISVNNVTLPESTILTGLKVNTIIIPLPPDVVMNGTNIIKFNLPDAIQLSNNSYGMSVRSLAITDTLPEVIKEEENEVGILGGIWEKV